jgi:hypothetical protein
LGIIVGYIGLLMSYKDLVSVLDAVKLATPSV